MDRIVFQTAFNAQEPQAIFNWQVIRDVVARHLNIPVGRKSPESENFTPESRLIRHLKVM